MPSTRNYEIILIWYYQSVITNSMNFELTCCVSGRSCATFTNHTS